jgi:NADH-quinone oxidoreductase subunit M
MNASPLITMLTLMPLTGGIIVFGLAADQKRLARGLALLFSGLSLALTFVIWAGFNPSIGRLQFEERHSWIPSLGVDYHVGIDGLGLLMILLTSLLVPFSMLASRNIEERVPLYHGFVLLLQSGLYGTFTALNFFHWFLYWELSLIPAFFLIKFWGGPMRSAAATRFFIYTMVGSVTLLLSFLAIFFATNQFDFIELGRSGSNGGLIAALSDKLGWRDLTTRALALVIFAGAFLGFAVKVPLFPFHSWLLPAYAEAPTGTVMLLTGLMSKMGVYGFLRILLPIFPIQMHWMRIPLLCLAVASIVFSAAAALAQRDLKRILGYSSINHLGYCLLAIFAAVGSSAVSGSPGIEKSFALNGVLLQIFNHGVTAATLFWFVGLLEQRRQGSRGLNDFGGIRKAAPVLCGLMGIALFSSLGLPGLNGFVGEFLIFKGVFSLATWAAAFSAIGLLLTALFILNVMQRVFQGPSNESRAQLADLTTAERALALAPIALMFVLGIYPQVLIGRFNSTVLEWVGQMGF